MAPQDVIKERSMILQKEMIEGLFNDLEKAHETGKKVCYTFVPGNLSELIRTFDMLPVYPEINALQSAMRKKSAAYIKEAERHAHSEDVCTYVKCDVGMLMKGNIGPTGQKLPPPDILLLSYTGCFTFMKWFETLKREYPNAEVVMIHTPYQEGGKMTPEMINYMVKQMHEEVIPKMERVSGVKYDENKLKKILEFSKEAEDWITKIFETPKHKPSPIDAYFAGVYYIGPINIGFRGTPEAVEYYKELYSEIQERIRLGLGPVTPEGEMKEEKFRLVVEGPPNWTSFREFWKIFYDMGAVIVASSYTKVGGVYDLGWRHDPEKPLQSLAEYCMNCYTNLNIPQRIDLLTKCIEEYQADGYVTNSIKSCNSFSAGQLAMMREIEDKLEIPVGFIESDLVDPRYFSYSNIKNRLESYFQMLSQRKMMEAEEAH
ncbi:MAG: benzoyl-CoA reductase subunit B [Bacteroidia bacterium]|nr:benzoyl-CoA reductase subunit B [Bacteroidia bacterium]MCO5254972.1 benzoyl-CoA reductase subunit B [Bacteroidota bacterium]MCZ2131265.1 benzoyl-CoA reductase subunit B [Bacteroidia bacterium]